MPLKYLVTQYIFLTDNHLLVIISVDTMGLAGPVEYVLSGLSAGIVHALQCYFT